MSSNDGVVKTLTVALLLCVACSIIVSTAAVLLRPMQIANKTLDKKRNILLAAGLYDESKPVDEQFASIKTRIVDLDSGRFTDSLEADKYDQRKAAKDPALSKKLAGEDDLAKISRRENVALVYLVENNGELEKVILPIHGYGLWSTLYGFIALESDLNTVAGLGFYDHAETPGLGGEVDNPRWKAQWPGKKIYQSGEVEIALAKGLVDPGAENINYRVDGLSGATLTSRGVSNLIAFWLGEKGFKMFLNNLKTGEA